MKNEPCYGPSPSPVNMTFYKAGSFLEVGPVSDLDVHVQIPEYSCAACGQSGITSYYNYPLLEPEKLLSKRQLQRLGPAMQIKSTNEELLEIVDLLRAAWTVPITAGTILGPTRLKVTAKPKTDLYVLLGHAGFFCRRGAAEKLKSEGVPIEWVTTPVAGKYAAEADYVEIAVPVMGHNQLPEGKSFCEKCLRYSPSGSFKTVLSPVGLPTGQPFF